MVTVNCAALPAQLAESELFGHVEGAFTGAVASRVGKFEAAHGGTLFLDEIGELSLDIQAKLLRVLQQRELERVGSGETVPLDVRVIAATNRDLAGAVDEGSFRPDLYYRLSVFPIHVPPLRDRKDDLAPLVEHFIERAAARLRLALPAVLSYYVTVASADNWSGAVCNLGRYIMPVVPWMAALLAVALASAGHRRGATTSLGIRQTARRREDVVATSMRVM